MKPLDTFLWPLVSKRWAYALVLFMAWSCILPVVALSLLLPGVPCVVMLTVGVAALAAVIFAIVNSRSRYVTWRKWSGWRNG